MAPSSPLGVPEDALSTRHVVENPIASLSVMFFLYGFYIVLFGYSVHIFYRPTSSCHSLHKAGIVVLFILATLGVINKTIVTIRQSIMDYVAIRDHDYTSLVRDGQDDILVRFHDPFMHLLFLLENLATDSMLVHRCYVIWGFRRWVALPFICATLVTSALGLESIVETFLETSGTNVPGYGRKLFSIYIFINIGVNLVLTLVTGGRFCWLCNQIKNIAEPDLSLIQWAHWRKCRKALALILESGILYPVVVVIYVAVDLKESEKAAIDLLPVAILVAVGLVLAS